MWHKKPFLIVIKLKTEFVYLDFRMYTIFMELIFYENKY